MIKKVTTILLLALIGCSSPTEPTSYNICNVKPGESLTLPEFTDKYGHYDMKTLNDNSELLYLQYNTEECGIVVVAFDEYGNLLSFQ